MSMQLDKASVFTDLAGLQSIKRLPRGESEEALRAVAEQFESIFVNMMMKSMRDSNAVFEEGSLTSSNEQKFYRDMFDQQLSLTMASGRGVGLADVLVRQLSKSYGAEVRQTSENLPGTALDTIDHKPVVEMQGDTGQETPDTAPVFESPQAFVDYLYPRAQKIASRLGLDPRFMVSQAALETGWGQKVMSRADGGSSYNLFGIKADERWQGEVARVSTLEYRGGIPRREQASFRVYNSFDESLEDFADFLSSSQRYQKALSVSDDPEQFILELQHAGYATDPAYADKISNIANGDVFDKQNLQGKGAA